LFVAEPISWAAFFEAPVLNHHRMILRYSRNHLFLTASSHDYPSSWEVDRLAQVYRLSLDLRVLVYHLDYPS
jgi:hypothetical protein